MNSRFNRGYLSYVLFSESILRMISAKPGAVHAKRDSDADDRHAGSACWCSVLHGVAAPAPVPTPDAPNTHTHTHTHTHRTHWVLKLCTRRLPRYNARNWNFDDERKSVSSIFPIYFDGNIASFVFFWLCDYKRLNFCCFVHILRYDNVREGKGKLEIRSQFAKTKKKPQKKPRFKDSLVKIKRHVHGHSRVFHVSRYRPSNGYL